jgi:hypothetical protein
MPTIRPYILKTHRLPKESFFCAEINLITAPRLYMQWNGKMEKRAGKGWESKYKGKGGSSNFCTAPFTHAETHKVYFFLEERYPELYFN